MSWGIEPYQIEDQWFRHLPLLHRILIDPTLVEQFPAAQDARSTDEACPIWEALHYLLKALLGWTDPAAGMAWWYEQGKPVEDSRLLRTVLDIWDRKDAIDFYVAWAWKTTDPTANNSGASLLPDAWFRAFSSRGEPSWANPFYGGSNPLHLGHSDWFGFDEPESEDAELQFDVISRRATLIVNCFGSWRRDLKRTENRLPQLGSRSWHVKVFDPHFGFLGTFRRSRQTGLWFAGKHSIHSRGNPMSIAES